MTEKIQSEITRIDLTDATYQNSPTCITPTYINYFFGNNGTGKSTIAKTLKAGKGITYTAGKTKDNYLMLVFDQEFIDANMRSYGRLPGVFTINEKNVHIQEQIDQKLIDKAKAEKCASEANTSALSKGTEKEKLLKQLYLDCWSKTEKLRNLFDNTQNGKRKSKQFTEEVQRHTPVEHDLTELKRMYDSVYSDNAKNYQYFNTISDTQVLDKLDGIDILDIVIVNTSNTPFAEFLKEVGSAEWVEKGHKDYKDTAKDKCPYCSRTLPDDFEEILSASFDRQYQINREKLNNFLDTYRAKANSLFIPLGQIPDELYPEIDIKPYNDKLAAIKGTISSNLDKIKEKISEPSKIIELDDTATLLQELSDIITGYNKLIKGNNDIVAAGPKKKSDCTNMVFEHIAFVLKDVIEAYNRSNKVLDEEIKILQGKIDWQKTIMKTINGEISTLSSQTVETESAMKAINTMLKDSGFQGFELRPAPETMVKADGSIYTFIPSPVLNYAVVRTETGKVAENLSEGEKNFIAFLYFQQLVFGSESSDGETREKIVVIDDPVSSMDSSALFIVSSLIRKMIEICKNNVDNRDPVVPGNFIKQIFILTHNTYFHREVTYAYANRYDFVSFYIIRKTDNKSHIRLMDAQDPNCPTRRINVNPVKNSYAALWEEYKDITTGIPLMNIIRRILEYYFLQLCGYEGNDLRKRILEENKDAFTHDELGNEDYTKYDMAAAMLSYIAANNSGINDGMDFVDDCVDVNQCKETFYMIFKFMNQEQHYDMMMGIK